MFSIAIIINSCNKFYKNTIGPIIESAEKANIPGNNIYFVVGECDKETGIIRHNNYNIVFCRFVNIDYNGILYFTQTETGIKELKKYTHFFYIHDTSIFMDYFWEKINNYAGSCTSYIKLLPSYTKNIGLLNVEWFILNKKDLFNYFINYDKTLVLKYKVGDFPNKDIIYNRFSNIPRDLYEDCFFDFDETYSPIGSHFENNNNSVYYEKKYSDKERLATEYLEPGIIKYQMNWHPGNWSLHL
jgi:hypothetical protein